MRHLLKKKATGWRSLLVIGATEGDFEDADDSVQGVGGAKGGEHDAHSEERFCPLTGFDISGVDWSMPEALKQIAKEEEKRAAAGGEAPSFNATRIWVRGRGAVIFAARPASPASRGSL